MNGFAALDFRAKAAVLVGGTGCAVLCDRPLLSVCLALLAGLGAAASGVPRAMLGLLLRVMVPFSLLLLLTHGFFNVAHVQRLTGLEALSVLWRVPAALPVGGGVALSTEGLRYGVNVVAKSLTLLLLVPPLVLTRSMRSCGAW
jgi:energy-coupling factor transport system permease protein